MSAPRHRPQPTGDGPVVVDLSARTFVDPAGLVSLAVVTEDAVRSGRAVRFTAPKDLDVASYLARMRLAQHLDRLGIAHALPAVQPQERPGRLVELHRFDSAAGLDMLLDALVHTFDVERPALLQPLYAALGEIAGNVVEHSGRSHGHLALQRYAGRRQAVEFAVGDSGVGLRARLSESVEVPDDGTAIVRAAQIHVSTTGRRGRGRGINEVVAIAGEHGGEVTLTSGRASGTFTHGDLRPRIRALTVPHPGTLAHVRLSL